MEVRVVMLIRELERWLALPFAELAAELWPCADCNVRPGVPCMKPNGRPLEASKGKATVHPARALRAGPAAVEAKPRAWRKLLFTAGVVPEDVMGLIHESKLFVRLAELGRLETV